MHLVLIACIPTACGKGVLVRDSFCPIALLYTKDWTQQQIASYEEVVRFLPVIAEAILKSCPTSQALRSQIRDFLLQRLVPYYTSRLAPEQEHVLLLFPPIDFKGRPRRRGRRPRRLLCTPEEKGRSMPARRPVPVAAVRLSRHGADSAELLYPRKCLRFVREGF